VGTVKVLTEWDVEVEVEPQPAMTLLLAAISQGRDIPFACLGGECHTCKVRILDGAGELMDPHEGELISLGEEEIQQGYRLSCQALCKGLEF
jgi:ferredoxin, 2Fe-2S